jgi:hypothetical protein
MHLMFLIVRLISGTGRYGRKLNASILNLRSSAGLAAALGLASAARSRNPHI